MYCTDVKPQLSATSEMVRSPCASISVAASSLKRRITSCTLQSSSWRKYDSSDEREMPTYSATWWVLMPWHAYWRMKCRARITCGCLAASWRVEVWILMPIGGTSTRVPCRRAPCSIWSSNWAAVRPISCAPWITELSGMRVSMRASGSLSMPIRATCSGTSMPAMIQACISWRARASVTAMMPTGLGRLCSHWICCSTASSQAAALVPRPRYTCASILSSAIRVRNAFSRSWAQRFSCASGRLNMAKLRSPASIRWSRASLISLKLSVAT